MLASSTASAASDFAPRHRVPRPVAGSGQRVDRIDRPAHRTQRCHPQPAISFDRDRDWPALGVAGFGQQCQQLGEVGGVVVDPPTRHHTTVTIDDSDIVMVCSPIDSAVQVQNFITPSISVRVVTGGLTRRPNRGTQKVRHLTSRP